MEQALFTDLLVHIVDNRGKTCPTADDGIPLIATNCVKNSGIYPTFEKVRFVSKATHASWFRGHPEPGDFVFVTKGAPGQVCLVPDPVPFCIAQDMVALRADPNKVYPPYLFAALRSDQVQLAISNMHVGTMIPHFKKGDFDKLSIPLPDEKTQRWIGDMYMELSKKIELNQRTNDNLEASARALFKDWFVDFGPTRAKLAGRPAYLASSTWSLFPRQLSGEALPDGWAIGTLSQVADLNPESWTSANYPSVVSYVDLSGTKWGAIETVNRFSRMSAPSRAQRILRPGDTIVGTVRPGNGSYAYVSAAGLTGSTGFAVLRPKKAIYREAVYLASTSSENIERLAHLADGGAYPAVRPEVVAKTAFVQAPEQVFAAFSSLTRGLIDRAEANKQESVTLAATRDILLQRLMAGERHVREIDEMVSEAI